MTDDENESDRGPWRPILRWLGAAAAIAGIVGMVFQVIEWAGSRTPPTTQVGAGASAPAEKANGDEQFVQAGQCVRNVGDAESPVLKIASCGQGTQRVVARIEQAITDETQADALCGEKAPGYADFHYSNWGKRSDFVDVVFCLVPA
ncbi:hypothetical protein KBX06_18895 [Micromonospora sp. C31]|uniref:LppU/SCO3897 family protein n=1 Tax=Micromonospora sp. C31 TaxID=2824876 RepID=UPI001B364F08|nr:hypothetical protein [Micromonospora sp. C31]MBQ1075218.1 hypothetical protein [Micromonospora sp. C31]